MGKGHVRAGTTDQRGREGKRRTRDGTSSHDTTAASWRSRGPGRRQVSSTSRTFMLIEAECDALAKSKSRDLLNTSRASGYAGIPTSRGAVSSRLPQARFSGSNAPSGSTRYGPVRWNGGGTRRSFASERDQRGIVGLGVSSSTDRYLVVSAGKKTGLRRPMRRRHANDDEKGVKGARAF